MKGMRPSGVMPGMAGARVGARVRSAGRGGDGQVLQHRAMPMAASGPLPTRTPPPHPVDACDAMDVELPLRRWRRPAECMVPIRGQGRRDSIKSPNKKTRKVLGRPNGSPDKHTLSAAPSSASQMLQQARPTPRAPPVARVSRLLPAVQPPRPCRRAAPLQRTMAAPPAATAARVALGAHMAELKAANRCVWWAEGGTMRAGRGRGTWGRRAGRHSLPPP